MSNSLKNLVAQQVASPSVQALVMQTELDPLSGKGAPVAPPTYAGESGGVHAVSENAFVPELDDNGWANGFVRNQDGSPRLATRVAINSVGAESGRAETALWDNQDRLQVTWPAITVKAAENQKPSPTDLKEQEIADALEAVVSTWTESHRHVGANIKYAALPNGKQVWEDDSPGSVKALITSASSEHGDLLYQHFPNACVYGFWLSSGTAARHKLPRAYSSEIVGYGAHPIESGATKLDGMGGAPKGMSLAFKNGRVDVVAKGGKKPSEFGFGQVPASPATRAYSCELILQQASLSLSVLRKLKFETAEQQNAALTVLTLMVMAGHLLAQEDGFLRSGCALVPVDSRWGWRSSTSGRTVEELDIPTFDEVAEALRQAIQDAQAVGLSFADPIALSFSEAQRQVIETRVKDERAKSGVEEGS